MTTDRRTLLAELERRLATTPHDTEDEAIVRRVQSELDSDPELLGELIKKASTAVREWLVESLPQLIGIDVPFHLMQVYKRDPDPDIRSAALQLLMANHPSRARELLVDLRRKVHSDDYFEPEDALWALLSLRDDESAGEIRQLAKSRSDGLGLIAGIVADGLDGREDVIAARLLRHDEHYLTNWLARTAATLATPQLLEALRRAARDLPDEDCRIECATWLERRTAAR